MQLAKTLDHRVTTIGLIASFIAVSIFMIFFTRRIASMQEEITISQTQTAQVFGGEYK